MQLRCPLHLECVNSTDMSSSLWPEGMSTAKVTTSVASWSTKRSSLYWRYLLWKLRLMEVVVEAGIDMLMVDIDVLMLSPRFCTELVSRAASGHDLVIASDARTGAGTWYHGKDCPGSIPRHRYVTHDWVCAGLMYARNSSAARWVLQEAQLLMIDFSLTDQDALQTVLTGHAQVSVPSSLSASGASVAANAPVGARTSSMFLRAWRRPDAASARLSKEVFRRRGAQLNAKLKPHVWRRYQNELEQRGVKWTFAPLSHYTNGAILHSQWTDGYTFSAPTRTRVNGTFPLSVHANCAAKRLLTGDVHGLSFLFHPQSIRHLLGEHEHEHESQSARHDHK